jgi:methylated-DNA-protein-cysteine methyltransferase related protein
LAKSPFFARIKTDVLKIAACIPEGRLCTFADIGAHLDVIPRHIAYILATLEDDHKMVVPWYRVVGESGKIGTAKICPEGTSQVDLLKCEGVETCAGKIVDFSRHHIDVAATGTDIPKQLRPNNAPKC